MLGKRIPGSVLGDVNPVAVLDARAMQALGAPSIKELVKRIEGLTTASNGSAPVYLLNGRRISGFEELYSIPPEALERTEILPEQEAARFGFPPTVRVTNFITKKQFRAVTLQQLAGATTDGGGGTNYSEIGLARIDGQRRLTLMGSYFRHTPVLQSQRAILPDPDNLYAIGGNITGIGGGSIDPALDALAGRPVTLVPVPADPAARQALAGYIGADAPNLTDPGAVRTLISRNDMVRLEGSLAGPLGKTLSASFNVTAEAQRNAGLNGFAPTLLTVPGGGFLPFSQDVLLYRALPDAVLRHRSTMLTLHAGGSIQGGLGRWMWNSTASYDRIRSTALSDLGVPLGEIEAIVAAGGDPMTPVSATGERLRSRSRSLTSTLGTKTVATGPLVTLPAGEAQMTLAADLGWTRSEGQQAGDVGTVPGPGSGPAPALSRTTGGASVNLSVPIASRTRGFLPMLGQLSANGTIGVSEISDFGRLTSFNYAISWTPLSAIQLNVSFNDAQAAPAIEQLSRPVIVNPNTPFFDFVTGSSVPVTVIYGGNPALAPDRRQTTSVGLSLTPLKGKDLRLNLEYVDTRIRNQTGNFGSVTAAIQSAFPERFVRDATGRLITADLRTVTLARERERKLRVTSNFSAPLGPKPVPPAKDAAPPENAPARPSLYAMVTATYRLEDQLTLRPGLPALDLLGGDTLDGTGGRPRWEIESSIGLNVEPLTIGSYSRQQGPTGIRSPLPEADLRFSGRTWIVLYAVLQADKVVKQPWARGMTINLTAENLLNDRIDVRDRSGATPNRFQQAYLDPLGRSVRLGVRKPF